MEDLWDTLYPLNKWIYGRVRNCLLRSYAAAICRYRSTASPLYGGYAIATTPYPIAVHSYDALSHSSPIGGLLWTTMAQLRDIDRVAIN
jgi:hypothetical protein